MKIDDHSFLFTVAHVIDEARGPAGELCDLAVSLAESFRPIELTDHRVISTDRREYPDRYDDPLDMCIIVLQQPIAEELSKFVRFVTLNEIIDEPFSQMPGYYFFHGIPGSNKHFSFRRMRWQYRTIGFGSALYERPDVHAKHYHPGCHLEINYDGCGYDVSGWDKLKRLPALPGISGSSLWRLHCEHDDPTQWDISKVRLVGIVQSADHVTRTIRASRICFFFHMLATQMPQLSSRLRTRVEETETLVETWKDWPR